MTAENNGENGAGQCSYFIDLDWYREQERSFALLVAARLCPSSQKKKLPKTDAGLLNTVKQCCPKTEGYITPDMPLLESVFRLLLASGNKPLTLKQIQAKLLQRAGDTAEPRDFSIPKLQRIIDHDTFYGLRPTEPGEEEEASTSPQND